jgi:hypothetical protein
MKPTATLAIHASLIGIGAFAIALARPSLAKHEVLDFPVNPLGINRSPYGEVAAMAMQAPIDALWHQGALAKYASNPSETSSPAPCPPGAACSHPECQQPLIDSNKPTVSWNRRLLRFLDNLDKASTARTNRVPASPAHDYFIRRQIENKLRFAYHLDPSHYGNYNSLHFFLTEPAVGTRPVLTPDAARLANETIAYCLAEPSDPRPSLTAAAAATNVLHLMFADQQAETPYFTPAQMRECLELLNHAIATHFHLRKSWTEKGHDQLLSPMRMLEMDERLAFVIRIRDAAEPAVARFEKQSS